MPEFTDNLSAGLKAGMRRLAASVCVVSLCDQQGQRQVMTATAVTSVSDSPPALLVCINKEASVFSAVQNGGDFCVSILNQGQKDISALCAGLTDEQDRFSQGNWQDNDQGLPYLAEAEANFFCHNDKLIDYGSHLIAIGKLYAVRTAEGDVAPLLYADGSYCQLS